MSRTYPINERKKEWSRILKSIMKKKLKMILAPLLLVTLVGCGSKPTSTGGGGSTTPTPTTPGPITSVTPDTSTTTPITTTTPPPTTSTSPTPTTPPDTTVIPPDYDNYYNPEFSGYHVPKNVVNMHASYASAAAGTDTGFAGKIVGIQQYNNNPKANVFFANGTYGFRANNVPAEGLAIGQEYVVTGQKNNSSYYCVNYNKGGMSLTALKEGTISVSDLDLSNPSQANEGAVLSFQDALITKIIEDTQYPGIEVLYKTKQYSLTYPTSAIAAEGLTALLNADTVGHSISGKVALTGFAANQYTLLSASDLSVGGITHLDKRLDLDATNDNLSSSVNGNTVTFGKEGEILPLNSDNRNVASISLLLSTEVENWTDITSITLDDTTPITLPAGGETSLPIALDFTEVNSHTITIDYSIPYFKNYTITVNLDEGLVKEQPTAALIGVVSVNDANSDLILSHDQTKIESGKIQFFSESSIQAISIKGYSSRGYYVVLNVAAPVGYVAEEATIKRGDEVDSTPLSEYTTLDGDIIVIPYYIPRDTESPTINISIHWKTGVLAQEISLSIAGEVSYGTWQDAVVADGAIAPDQNSDIDGQPTGSIDSANPIKTSIDETKKVITFGDVGQQIAYYEADQNLGRAAGNRVGVTITSPTNAGNITNATVDIYLGGDLYKENLKWTESVETDGKLYWYPKITKDMLSTDDDTVVSTVSIKWGADVAADVYTIKVAAGTTLQAAPSQDPVELTTFVGIATSNVLMPNWTATGGKSGQTYGVGIVDDLKAIRLGSSGTEGSLQYNLPESKSINKVIVTLSAAQANAAGTLNIEVGTGAETVQGTPQQTVVHKNSANILLEDSSLLTFEIDTSSLSEKVTYIKIFTGTKPAGQMIVLNINISIIPA